MKNTAKIAACRAAAVFLAAAVACAGLTACGRNTDSGRPGQERESGAGADNSGAAVPGMDSPGTAVPGADIAGPGTDSPAGSPLSESGGVERLATAVYPIKKYKNDDEKWEAELEERQSIDADFCEKLTDFAYDTASPLLKGEEGNTVYSPLSLYYALALAAAGAEGETGEEILAILHGDDADDLAERAKKQFEIFYHDEDSWRFQMASSVWFDKNLSVKDAYLQTAADQFYADIFRGEMNTADMKEAMQDWVQEHTGGLLRPNVETEDIQMHLMNTVYYYAEWIDQFQKENTKEDDFHLADGSLVKCDFMNRTSLGKFYRVDGYLMANLSTKNGRVQFLLPEEGVDVMEFLESPERMKKTLEAYGADASYGEIVWKVPKFSYGSSFKLKDMLAGLGMEKAFGSDAEFTAMSDDNIWIDSVTQMVHAGINENGVEAAAFTDLGYAGSGMPEDRAEMILDRPFIYVVRDNYCGSVPIFIGVCADPSQGG